MQAHGRIRIVGGTAAGNIEEEGMTSNLGRSAVICGSSLSSVKLLHDDQVKLGFEEAPEATAAKAALPAPTKMCRALWPTDTCSGYVHL